MKLKNDREIGLIACEYADQCQKNRPQIAWVLFDVKEAYKKGYTQAQQDLLESCAEGFEEWIDTKPWINDPAKMAWCLEAWQAALSYAKKMQEK